MISNLAKSIKPSVTCNLEGIVADMHVRGLKVYELNAGEPDFRTPEPIVDACKIAMDQGKMKYVNVNGIIQLREAISKKLWRDNRVSYDPSQICVSTGAKQALFNVVLALINPGDEVIIPIPGWVSYGEMVKMALGVPVYVDTTEDYQLDLEKIRQAVTEHTRAIMINTPNNPTGAVYSLELLKALSRLAEEKNLYIISDEVYEKYTYDGRKHYSIAAVSGDAYNRTVLVNGFSKAYAMTGWRIGYSAAPSEIAAAITAIQSHITSNSTTMVQWAALEALESGEQKIDAMLAMYRERKQYVLQRLRKMTGIQCGEVYGAFYYLIDVTAYLDHNFPSGEKVRTAERLCEYFLKEAHVAVVPGEAFMAPGKIRLAYSNNINELQAGLDHMEEALKKIMETG